jgi:hypothetical protein
MLLCLSRRRFGVLWHTELAIELANNIALQAPRDLPFALALGGTFDHIALCGFVIAHSGDSNAVEGGIGLAVTAALSASRLSDFP